MNGHIVPYNIHVYCPIGCALCIVVGLKRTTNKTQIYIIQQKKCFLFIRHDFKNANSVNKHSVLSARVLKLNGIVQSSADGASC